MIIAREVAHITLFAGIGLIDGEYDNPLLQDFRDELISQNREDTQKFSRLLTEGYQIVCHTPVRAEGWCGVQYLLVKETEPGIVEKEE